MKGNRCDYSHKFIKLMDSVKKSIGGIKHSDCITLTDCTKIFKMHATSIRNYIGDPDYADKYWSKERILRLAEASKYICQNCGEEFYSTRKFYKYCRKCRIEINKKKRFEKVCKICHGKFITKSKDATICFSCKTRENYYKKNDPYGVMIRPTFRGRKCKCGKPVATGARLCDECSKREKENCRVEINDDFIYF